MRVYRQRSAASQAQPLPLWQVKRRLMQELPHALPLLHTRQQLARGVQLAPAGVAARKSGSSGGEPDAGESSS